MNEEKNKLKPVFFANQAGFRKWLKENHDKENELLVGFYKVGSGKQNMTWSQSVDEALCYGWIDGVRRSVDGDSYCIRFTPRRPGSNWSAVNIKKVAALTKQGLMQPAGLESFNKRKAHKSGIYSYENKAVRLPAEMERQFKENKAAWEFFESQAPYYRKTRYRWIMDAKQEATRNRRLDKVITASEAGQKLI
jgi:uncharacterized protein YdeI (YjbR/CyaY-like superfamily)